MRTLTHSQLRDLLYSLRGATPITVSALTAVKVPQKASGLKEVMKLARVNGMAGSFYHTAMLRKLGAYEPTPRAWGRHLSPSLIEHKGRFYVQIKIERALDAIYLTRKGAMLTVIRGEAVKPFLRPQHKAVNIREYALDSIKRVSIRGSRFRIVPDGTEV